MNGVKPMQHVQCNTRVPPQHRSMVLDVGQRLRDDPEFAEKLRTWLNSENGAGVKAMVRGMVDGEVGGQENRYSENSDADGDIGWCELHLSNNKSLKIQNGSVVGVVFKMVKYLAKVKSSKLFHESKYFNIQSFMRMITGYGGEYLDLIWIKQPGDEQWHRADSLVIQINLNGFGDIPPIIPAYPSPFQGDYVF